MSPFLADYLPAASLNPQQWEMGTSSGRVAWEMRGKFLFAVISAFSGFSGLACVGNFGMKSQHVSFYSSAKMMNASSSTLRRLASSPSARAAASAAAVTVAATAWLDYEEQNFGAVASCEQPKTSTNNRGPKLLFLGSGSSTGCPKPLCALAFPDEGANTGRSDGGKGLGYTCSCRDTGGGGSGSSSLAANINDDDPALVALQEQLGNTCRTSKLAAMGNPRNSKNYRNNPSLLISHQNNDDDQAFGTYGEESVPIRNVII